MPVIPAVPARELFQFIERKHIEQAIVLYEKLGRLRFLGQSGQGKSRRWFIPLHGGLYDSRPVVFVARSLAVPGATPAKLKGGDEQMRPCLKHLGFDLVSIESQPLLSRYLIEFSALSRCPVEKEDRCYGDEAFVPYKPAVLLAILDLFEHSPLRANLIAYGEMNITRHLEGWPIRGTEYRTPWALRGKSSSWRGSRVVRTLRESTKDSFWDVRDYSPTVPESERGTVRLEDGLFELMRLDTARAALRTALKVYFLADGELPAVALFPKLDVAEELALEDEKQALEETPGGARKKAREAPTSRKSGLRKVLREINVRRNQGPFRQALLVNYDGRCAISGSSLRCVLEAAHIRPWAQASVDDDDIDHPTNGLLLRSDLHTLYDLGLIWIDPDTMTVQLALELKDSEYAGFQSEPLRMPAADPPSIQALRERVPES